MNSVTGNHERTKLSEVRDIVTRRNRIDYEKIDYACIKQLISKLINGIPMQAHTLPKGTLLFRAVSYTKKPNLTSFLSHPPAKMVTGYQRCNAPGKPMFYASVDKSCTFSEINAELGCKVYLSKWAVDEEFFFFRIPPDVSDSVRDDLAFAKIETLFETRFSHPIHDTFSAQYKLTAAISEVFSTGILQGDSSVTKGRTLGGIVYPSVAHTVRSDNIAIQPTVVQKCLRLQEVYEIEITGRDGQSWFTSITDFSSEFQNGQIIWTGRVPQWNLGPGEQMIFTVENQEWVARRPDGTIITPS